MQKYTHPRPYLSAWRKGSCSIASFNCGGVVLLIGIFTLLTSSIIEDSTCDSSSGTLFNSSLRAWAGIEGMLHCLKHMDCRMQGTSYMCRWCDGSSGVTSLVCALFDDNEGMVVGLSFNTRWAQQYGRQWTCFESVQNMGPSKYLVEIHEHQRYDTDVDGM